MRAALVVLLAASAAACTPAQAPAMRTSGKWMAIGGVIGIVAAAFATNVTDKGDEMMLGCELVSAVGIVTYAYAELTWPRVTYRKETLPEQHHRWAKILTGRAAAAAREGRCARVKRLEQRVRTYDPELHDFVFMRDPEIVKCLTAPAPAPAPEPEPVPEAAAPEAAPP